MSERSTGTPASVAVSAAMYGFRRENPAPQGHDVMAVLGSPDASLALPMNGVVESAGSGL